MLVGTWVLLQPPVDGGGRVLVGAPLAEWVVNGRFPTEKKCEANRSNSQAAIAYAVGKGEGDVGPAADVVLKARCIELEELKKLLRPAPSDDDY